MNARESTICFLETRACSHGLTRYGELRHPGTGTAYVLFSLASSCPMKSHLWETDLIDSPYPPLPGKPAGISPCSQEKTCLRPCKRCSTPPTSQATPQSSPGSSQTKARAVLQGRQTPFHLRALGQCTHGAPGQERFPETSTLPGGAPGTHCLF